MNTVIPLGPCRWSEISPVGIDHWLWISVDPAAPAVLANELPETMPRQITHLWGWGPGRMLRARVDSSILPDACDGVVGALLGQDLLDGQPVHAAESKAQLWPLEHGWISMQPVPQLYPDGKPAGAIRLVTALLPQVEGTTTTLTPLQFVALEAD